MNKSIYLLVSLLTIILSGCYEMKKTDIPTSRENAISIADQNLPIPVGAINVQFSLTGKTQSWTLYMTYKSDKQTIEDTLNSDKTVFIRNREIAGLKPITFVKLPISTQIDSQILAGAPKWWKPSSISAGYFFGNADQENIGPFYWVDESSDTVFLFQRY